MLETKKTPKMTDAMMKSMDEVQMAFSRVSNNFIYLLSKLDAAAIHA